MFPYLVTKLASIGGSINSTNKNAGLVSASFPVGLGQGSTTTMNAIVSTNKPTGVKIDITFIAAAGIAFSLGDAQEEFCSILEDAPR